MRYLVSFVCVVAMVALPLSAGAQASDKERREDFYPGTLPQSEQEFDEDRLGDFYPVDARKEPARPKTTRPKARGGLIASSVIVAGGAAAMGGAAAVARNADDLSGRGPAAGLGIVGAALIVGGIIGIGISGKRLSTANRKQQEVEQAQHGTARRLQWDLEASRLVF
jgi:hypothetical protein